MARKNATLRDSATGRFVSHDAVSKAVQSGKVTLLAPTPAQRKAFNSAMDAQPARTVKWDPSKRSAAPGSPEGMIADSLLNTATKRKPKAPGIPAAPKTVVERSGAISVISQGGRGGKNPNIINIDDAGMVEMIVPPKGKPYAPKRLKVPGFSGKYLKIHFDLAIEYSGPRVTGDTIKSGTPNMMDAIKRHGVDANYIVATFSERHLIRSDRKRWYLIPITPSITDKAKLRATIAAALTHRKMSLVALRLDEPKAA